MDTRSIEWFTVLINNLKQQHDGHALLSLRYIGANQLGIKIERSFGYLRRDEADVRVQQTSLCSVLLSEGIPRDKLSTRGNGNGCQKSSPVGSGSMGQLPSPLPVAVT
jgi:hypothetical protein